MKRVLILGAGKIGSCIARELSKDFAVTANDLSLDVLEKLPLHIRTIHNDITISQLKSFDIIINALPGTNGFITLQSCIQVGKNVVDISFMSEDPYELDQLAKDNGVVAIIDCGLEPGIPNILIGHEFTQLDKIQEIHIRCGGLPKNPDVNLWKYQSPYCVSDSIAFCTNPVRTSRNGQLIKSDEVKVYQHRSNLENFLTDGVRTLARNIKAYHIETRTYRYKGFFDKMNILKQSGFLDEENLKFTTKILEKAWATDEYYRDISLLDVHITGYKNDNSTQRNYILRDEYDEQTKTTSMARTTAYTACAAVRLLANDLWTEPGIIAPEILGMNKKCYEFFQNQWKSHNINIEFTSS